MMATFQATNDGRFEFETELISGTIVADGQQHFVTDLMYKPTQTRVDSGMMLAPYRLLSQSGWMGEVREMPHEVQARDDGIEVTWPATLAHQATLTTRLTVLDPGYIDTTVTVTGQGYYRDYEVFMSSYFAGGFRSGGYLASLPEESNGSVVQVQPVSNPIFREMYLAFPRDEQSANRITDGRWHRGRHHTRFLPARYYGFPLGFYSACNGPLDVLFMGTPSDVFAVNMAYFTEDPNDHVGQHNSLYLSLFGRDLHPGERWETRVRMAFGDFDRSEDEHHAELDRFLSSYIVSDRLALE